MHMLYSRNGSLEEAYVFVTLRQRRVSLLSQMNREIAKRFFGCHLRMTNSGTQITLEVTG